MSECHCIIKHTTDPETRAWMEEEYKTAKGQRAVALAVMLSPCPSQEEAS